MSRSTLNILASLLFTAGMAADAGAQETTPPAKAPSDATVSKTEIRNISVKPPQADSPFFIERQEAKAASAEAGREGFGMYVPKPPHPPAQEQIKKFFRGLFGGGSRKGKTEGPAAMTLQVEPADFSLAQTSELEVSLKISNARKQEIELLFPDNQRLEIVTKDASGQVISRWSEDRSFDSQEGFAEINPDEFIIYAERIPTSKMKAGETYTVEASLANQEGYSTTATLTPRP